MPLRKITLFIISVLAGGILYSGPAYTGKIFLSQPDGSVFAAYRTGDEFLKITRTYDGDYVIVQDDNGWWCYAAFNPDGTQRSTGVRAGAPASAEIIDASRNIPWAVLAEKANLRRASYVFKEEKPLIGRIAGRRLSSDDKSDSGPLQKHGIALLVQYKNDDGKFKYGKEDFLNLLNSPGYDGTGSVIDYFNDQFRGKVEFHFDVSDIITLPRDKAYYGGNTSDGDDKRPGEMIYEACRLADASVDFSLYDDDGDGYVDNLFVFFAGKDEASGGDSDCIWSHAWTLESAGGFGDGPGVYRSADGVIVNRYACTSELRFSGGLCGIGTFCHEYSHTLGLPDLYDTDYDYNGLSAAMWDKTALMDGGNYNGQGSCPPNFNCIEREIAGISVPEEAEWGEYVLSPIHISGRCLKFPTSTEGEYFLIECRSNDGWDKYIGGSGMLVYHIDKTEPGRWGRLNSVNTVSSHQRADLIEADKRNDRAESMSETEYKNLLRNLSGIFFPAGNTLVSSAAYPAFKSWDGNELPFCIDGIGLTEDGSVRFTISPAGQSEVPEAKNISTDIFYNAAIVNWESSFMTGLPAYISLSEKESGNVMEAAIEPYDGNKYSTTIENLRPDTAYGLAIRYSAAEDGGKSAAVSFVTPQKPATDYPYIYMIQNGVLKSGTRLPLRVMNSDPASVSWKIDGKTVHPEEDGYYHPEDGSHEITASVTLPDGTEDIITRHITVR